MVCYCTMAHCSKTGKDKSDFRHFLRFYKFPANNKALCAAWVKRSGLDPKSMSLKGTNVCSEHFNDSDFEEEHWKKSLLLHSLGDAMLKGYSIRLKPEALPNTEELTIINIIRHFKNLFTVF